MTQTIKERSKLLKKRNPELNEYADNYAQHIYVRNKGFNEGVDACLPLLEEVVREELEAIMRVDTGSVDATRVAVHQRLEALTDTKYL